MKSNPAKGAYALVFLDKQQGRVHKLFKTSAWDNTVSDADRKRTFGYELEAYKIAASDETLRNYIPRFHGQLQVTKVIDTDGTDISGRFFLDHCYCLDLIQGPETKIGAVMGGIAHIERMVKEFHERGVMYLEDASVFFAADEAKTKVIDIATTNLDGDPMY
jgi:hypothetical protein